MLKKFWEFIRFIVIFLLFFGLIYGILNYSALSNYMSHYQDEGEHIVNLHNKNIFTEEEAEDLPKSPKDHLIIPVLHMDVPIVWEAEEKDILKKLKKGVVRFPNTALPGEVGNIFVVGHSSNYWWDKGQYNSIFAALGQLKKNDEILINYHDTQYIYKVTNMKVVMPNQTKVLKSGDESILSLMTCTPIGTNWKRLIVISEQLWPEPNTNTNFDQKNIQNQDLPSIR